MVLKTYRPKITSLLATIGLIGIGPLYAAPGDAGTVLAQAGECFVQAGAARAPLKIGDTVHVGDTVEASTGARVKLRLDDGSVISIASGSRMRITAYSVGQSTGRDIKLSLGAGLLRAVVTVFSQPSHFEINTATGVAAVRSTDWFIEAKPDSTQVGVLKGRVSLTSVATGRSVEVPARWGARVEQGRDPVPGRTWTTAEFNDVIARTDVNPGR